MTSEFRPRLLTVLVISAVVLAGCGGGEGAASTTIAPTTTTSTPAPTTTTTLATTSTTSLPGITGETLLVVGDWGTGTAPQGAVAGAMQRYADDHDVAAILTTGDNLLSDDAEFIMHPYGWAEEAGLDWWITWGDRDVETDSRIEAVNQTFENPPRWTTVPWGDIEILILDSTQAGSTEQLEYFETALAASEEPTIVVFHHPAVSCMSPEEAAVQQGVASLIDDDVLLVLHGHENNYQRFDVDGVGYLVTGGGGSPITPLTECPADGPQRLAGDELHHFLALTQDGGSLLVQAIDVNGAIFDEVTIPVG